MGISFTASTDKNSSQQMKIVPVLSGTSCDSLSESKHIQCTKYTVSSITSCGLGRLGVLQLNTGGITKCTAERAHTGYFSVAVETLPECT